VSLPSHHASEPVRRLAAPFRYLRLVAPIATSDRGLGERPQPLTPPSHRKWGEGFDRALRVLFQYARSGVREGQSRGTKLSQSAVVGLVLPALILALWQAAASFAWVPRNLLPSPGAVVAALYDLALRGELWGHIEITLSRVLLGFLLGTVVATLLGALTGYSATARRLLDPTLQALQNVPSIAWVPLFILWLGIFEASKVTLIAVGVFFPVYLNLMSGIQQVDRKLVEVGRIYGFSGIALIRRVLLPATLPFYVTGLRGGLGLGWMFVLAAEFMGASEGLGYLLIDGEQTGRPQIIVGAILLFAVLGKLSDVLLVAATRRFTRWQDSFQAASEKTQDAANRRRLEAV
jgi:sulfonate transport system permease protein